MSGNPWITHKFGGTSVADAAHYRNVARILTARGEPRQAIVVSAMKGMTDALFRAVEYSGDRNDQYRRVLEDACARQSNEAQDLVGDALEAVLQQDSSDIHDVLRSTWLLRRPSRDALDLVTGYGELWSARLLAEYLRKEGHNAAMLDARDVLVIEQTGLGPAVKWEASQARLDRWLEDNPADMLVITGYVASDPQGRATTLGRNGSDFSASIFAVLLEASEVYIWTDVDGVLSADPRLVPEAQVLDQLSYDEALELAYFGAKVLHPQTMAPVIQKRIPIFIRNSINPEAPGTRIDDHVADDFQIKGISAIGGLALINLEGAGMIGVPGTARRVFGALREASISVVMISQASSEHSICFALNQEEADAARELLLEAFERELRYGQIQSITKADNCSVLAIVGEAMAGQPGVAAKFFGALGSAGINIRAIAQGSSERNISVVLDSAEVTRALRAVHAGFYLSAQTLSLGVIGCGHVGGALLAQLGSESARLRESANLDLRVRGICTSSKMLLSEQGIDLTSWREALDKEGVPLDRDAFFKHVKAEHLPHTVMVDCTASQAVSDQYEHWLGAGAHVVTPNKKANSGPLEQYQNLRQVMRREQTHFLYETNVGAGLPIIQSLRDLRQTGDQIREIGGMFSGTLSYLFNLYDGTRPFSELVKEARESGYTEPDPRDDLSGMDVARKVVILAREAGLDIGVEDLSVESLVPKALVDVSLDEFLSGLAEYDDEIHARYSEAAEAKQVLRFVGQLDASGTASVGLKSIPLDHPFANIALTDNIVQFVTDRYLDNPLVVQGPGAGPDVTAAGIFADILRLASFRGAQL